MGVITSEHPEETRRFLIKESPHGIGNRGLIGMLMGGGCAYLLFGDLVEWATLIGIAGGFGIVCTLLIAWLFPPPKVCVFVGVDGVAVWGRFIPYATIGGVRQEWEYRPAGSSGYGGPDASWSEADIQTMFLDLRSGESLRVDSLEYERSSTGKPQIQNDRGSELTRAIEAGLAAWLAGHGRPEPTQEGLIARGERTFPEWVEALRRLGSGAGAAYRGLPVDLEALSRVLAEPLVRPSTRAAAAVALAAAGDQSAGKKLRIAAANVADPRLRIALEKVADEAKDAAVVEALEALEALEAAEHDARTSRTS